MALKRSFSNFFRRYHSGIDVPLFVTVVVLCLFGVFNMYGIGGSHPLVIKQSIFAVAGVLLMSVLSFFNYRYFKNSSRFVLTFYIGAVLFLALPFLFDSIRGVQSWVVVGGGPFLAPRIIKIIFFLVMGKNFFPNPTLLNNFRHVVI